MAANSFDLMLQALAAGRGGDPSVSPAIQAWLLYGKPLDNPAAIAFVKQYFPDLRVQVPADRSTLYRPGPIVGATGAIGVGQRQGAQAAGGYAHPQAAQQPTAQAVPASPGGAPGAPQAVANPGVRAGIGPTEGGLYQAYTANQRAAVSRPIAENPIKGPNAGDNVTPAPPVTAATTPNATNPTEQKPPPAPTGGSVMATPPPIPVGNPNDLNFVQGSNLVGANAQADVQLREALRAAGYDPSHLGLGGQYFAKLIQPTLAAEASLYGFGNAAGADVTKGRDFVANLVRSFITPGVNAAGQAAQYAQGIMGNPAFQQTINDLPNDQQRQQVLQNLAGLMYGNRSALEQSAAAANFDRGLSAYQDAGAGFGGPNGDQRFTGTFSDWLTGTPEGQRLARMIGLGG